MVLLSKLSQISLKTNNAFQVNFHMALFYVLFPPIVYPFVERSPLSLTRLGLGFLYTGLPLALAQSFFIGGLTMSRETGVLSMVTLFGVGVSYLISILRYHEDINMASLLGLILLAFGMYLTIFKKDRKI